MKNQRKSRSYSYYTPLPENKTSFEKKLERLTHDPIRYETGASYQDSIGSIKAVRLG